MKRYSILAIAVLMVLGFLAFHESDKTNRSGIDSDVENKLDLTDFSSIDLGISGDVMLTQSRDYEVVVEASEKDREKLEIEVQDNKLKIRSKSRVYGNFGKVMIYVSCPRIEALHISGSGTIQSNMPIDSEELSLKVAGSGKIKLNALDAKEVYASVSGSGDIIINAPSKAKVLEVNISGSGSVLCEDLKVNESEIHISGSGNCKTFATDELEAKISGSGSIYYKGSPEIDAKISGSGKVKRL